MFSVGKKSRQRTELLLGVDCPSVDHLGTVLDDLLDLARGEQVLKAQLEADNIENGENSAVVAKVRRLVGLIGTKCWIFTRNMFQIKFGSKISVSSKSGLSDKIIIFEKKRKFTCDTSRI